MENNISIIENVITYIEHHLLEETLNLESISQEVGYSKYHLHRIVSSALGLTLHTYIQRRRLTEAAKLLVFTRDSILDIALLCGYETQRSFSKAFKKMFKHSPKHYRMQEVFMPVQLPFDIHNLQKASKNIISNITYHSCPEMQLIGYRDEIKRGFFIIGKLWHKLHKHKATILHKSDPNFLIGINDYANYKYEDDHPMFHYFAGAQVNNVDTVPKGMTTIILPESKYVVFTFRGRNEDSLEAVINYVYQEWFLNSTCRFNELHLYDFIKYGEQLDEQGLSDIELWIPVL